MNLPPSLGAGLVGLPGLAFDGGHSGTFRNRQGGAAPSVAIRSARPVPPPVHTQCARARGAARVLRGGPHRFRQVAQGEGPDSPCCAASSHGQADGCRRAMRSPPRCTYALPLETIERSESTIGCVVP